ncbi:MAG: hypothetical protein ACXVGN_07075 [Mycobacteriaceae bacterium]
MRTRTARTACSGTLQDGSGVAEAAHLPSGEVRRRACAMEVRTWPIG